MPQVIPTSPETSKVSPLLDIRGLRTEFRTDRGTVRVLNDVSFSVASGEVLGLVGESGSGKSVTALSLLGLVPRPGRVTSGEAFLGGRDLMKMSHRDLSNLRGRDIGLVLQDAMTALNPVLTIGQQIGETLNRHLGLGRSQARRRAVDLLDRVGIPDPSSRVDDYPHQFSGGMRQRAMIAMALSCEPKLLIADEPTTALDVTIQAQVLDLLRNLKDEMGMSLIMITHDLGIIAGLADRVAVMYAGSIVESGPVRQVFKSPAHPYTQGLLASIPSITDTTKTELQAIPGLPPDLAALPQGCAFAPRCAQRRTRCETERPRLLPHNAGGVAACWLVNPAHEADPSHESRNNR
ncbi:ABC transporter ATP-binding protein [Litoreibacter albidus]|uniref:ABC transporter ATP-binding protein n=1 Tax=Litoreibacter albidus TaxID=670155 RepID=UPI003735A59C